MNNSEGFQNDGRAAKDAEELARIQEQCLRQMADENESKKPRLEEEARRSKLMHGVNSVDQDK